MSEPERGDVKPAWENEGDAPATEGAQRRQDPRGEPTVGGANPIGLEQLDQQLDEDAGMPATHTGSPD